MACKVSGYHWQATLDAVLFRRTMTTPCGSVPVTLGAHATNGEQTPAHA